MIRSVLRLSPSRLLAVAGMLLPMTYSGAALAQNLPGGSYLQSCTNAAIADGTLVAQCRRIDQTYRMTSLPQAWQCQGRISNNDGKLECPGGQDNGGNRPAAPPPPQTSEFSAGNSKINNVCRDGAAAYLSLRWRGAPELDMRMVLDNGNSVKVDVPRGTSYSMECGRPVAQQASYRYLNVSPH